MKFLRLRFLAILVVFLWGCMKTPEYNQDFGPEVSGDSIAAAINEAPTASVYSIKKGEFASSQKTQQVQSNQPVVVFQLSNTVTDKTEDASNYYFTIIKKTAEMIDGQMKPTTTESHAVLAKPTPTPAAAPASDSPKSLPTLSIASVQTAAADGAVTFHNLRVDDISVNVPTLVLQRSDCGGLSPDLCHGSIPAKRISFDQVNWKGGVGNKYSVSYTISSMVPFFASQLQECVEANVPYQQQLVHVIQCTNTVDFTTGHD